MYNFGVLGGKRIERGKRSRLSPKPYLYFTMITLALACLPMPHTDALTPYPKCSQCVSPTGGWHFCTGKEALRHGVTTADMRSPRTPHAVVPELCGVGSSV